MLLSFFYQRQILQLQPSSLKKSPSLWGKGKIFYNWNAAMRPHSYPVASLVRRCTHDRPHGKAVPSPRVSSPLPRCLRERHHPQLVSIQQWKKKKIETDWKQVKRSSISYQQLCNTLLFWRILLYAVIWLILHSNHLCLCLCSSGTSKWLTISVNLHSSLTDLNQEKQHDSQRDFKSTSKQQMYISVQLSEWQMNLFQDILQYICLVRAGNFW